MPLFMLISGYFLGVSTEHKSCVSIIKNRIGTILIPILSWSLLRFALTVLRELKTHTFTLVSLLEFFDTLIYFLWFLWAVLVCTAIVLVVRAFFGDHLIVYIMIVLFSLFCPDKYNFEYYAFMFPYFCVGYLWEKRKFFSRLRIQNNRNGRLLWGCLVIGHTIGILFYRTDYYIYTTGTFLFKNNLWIQLGIDLYRWLTGFLGSGAVLLGVYLAMPLVEKWQRYLYKASDFLRFLAMNSMGIYIVDAFLNRYILLKVTADIKISVFVIVVETIVVLAIIWGVIKILQRNNLLNKLFLGGR